jgi:hypothetical protein
MPKPTGPAICSAAYEAMVPVWEKIEALLGGTDSMRAAGHIYLPQHDGESDNAFRERLDRNYLLNMLAMTLDSWVGKPFSDPIGRGDNIPDKVKEWLDNVDLQGNNIDVFARNWFKNGLAKGLSHVLVEFPRPQQPADGRPRTLADDRDEKLRPYLVHVLPENCHFAYAEVKNGREELIHVRIREQITKLVGFEEVNINRIRVIEPGFVKIYEERKEPRTKKVVWVIVESYSYDLDFVPLVTFYADREELMKAKPPLVDLADMNIAHWQSRSDQTAVLTVARFPILGVSGAISDDDLTVGPNEWLHCPDPAGRFYYVEHSGKAIAAGRQDLLDLEETMAEYGATFLKKRPGGASATARALDTAEVTSPLQDMAIRFQAALQQAMSYMGEWAGVKEVGTFTINLDFGFDEGDTSIMAELRGARENGDLSRTRYLRELHRLGAVGEDFDYDKNESEIKAEKKVDAAEQEDTLKLQAKYKPAPAAGPGKKKLPPVPAKPPKVKQPTGDPVGGGDGED